MPHIWNNGMVEYWNDVLKGSFSFIIFFVKKLFFNKPFFPKPIIPLFQYSNIPIAERSGAKFGHGWFYPMEKFVRFDRHARRRMR
ncbi:MAG: hypothetical protein ACE5IH_09235 [Thermodesulfobacteriota bacterium]